MAAFDALVTPSAWSSRGGSNRMSDAASFNLHEIALASISYSFRGPNMFNVGRRQSMGTTSRKSRSLTVCAAKLPAGVETPVTKPQLQVSLWGFTEKAEVWNSRAAMIGLFALIALEFFARKGILQIIGVDVGKGLDLPL